MMKSSGSKLRRTTSRWLAVAAVALGAAVLPAGPAHAAGTLTLTATYTPYGKAPVSSTSGLSVWEDDTVTFTAHLSTAIPAGQVLALYNGAEDRKAMCAAQACTVTLSGETGTDLWEAYLGPASDFPGVQPLSGFHYLQASNHVTIVGTPRPGISAVAIFTTDVVGNTDVLAANASVSLTNSPYLLRIYDSTSGQYVDCTTGTSCTENVTSTVASTHTYGAHLDLRGSYTILESTGTSYYTWEQSQTPELYVSLETVQTGDITELKATSDVDLGQTPYFLEIFNLDTGKLASEVPSGTVCYWADRNGGPFIAVIAPYSQTFTTSGIEANSSNVLLYPTIH